MHRWGVAVKTLHRDTAVWRTNQCPLAGQGPSHPGFLTQLSGPRAASSCSDRLQLRLSCDTSFLQGWCTCAVAASHLTHRLRARGCSRSRLQRTVGGL